MKLTTFAALTLIACAASPLTARSADTCVHDEKYAGSSEEIIQRKTNACLAQAESLIRNGITANEIAMPPVYVVKVYGLKEVKRTMSYMKEISVRFYKKKQELHDLISSFISDEGELASSELATEIQKEAAELRSTYMLAKSLYEKAVKIAVPHLARQLALENLEEERRNSELNVQHLRSARVQKKLDEMIANLTDLTPH